MNASQPLMIGRSALPLEDRGLLGQGGMGQVRRVYDPRFGREAALKILLQSQDPQQVMRFVREVRISARLDHPGIPPVYDSGRLPQGQHYMLMKLVQGETLKQRLDDYHQQGRPPRLFRDFIETLLRVCEAVSYAHDQGLVHRDLKPENIMIGSFFEVLVMDWGLARDVRESEAQDQQFKVSVTGLTEDGEVLGTPAYMSPEQARGESLDQQTDVFALGVILGNILTDQPLVSLSDPLKTVFAMGEGRYQSPAEVDPSVPRDWSEVAERAMALDPGGRTASAHDFADQLKLLLAKHSGQSSPNSKTSRLGALLLLPLLLAVVAVSVKLVQLRTQIQKQDSDNTALEQQRRRQWQARETQEQRALSDFEERLQRELEAAKIKGRQRAESVRDKLREARLRVEPLVAVSKDYKAFKEVLAKLRQEAYLRAPDQNPRQLEGRRIDYRKSHEYYSESDRVMRATLAKQLKKASHRAVYLDIVEFLSEIMNRREAGEVYEVYYENRPFDAKAAYRWYLYSIDPGDRDLVFLERWLRVDRNADSDKAYTRLLTALKQYKVILLQRKGLISQRPGASECAKLFQAVAKTEPSDAMLQFWGQFPLLDLNRRELNPELLVNAAHELSDSVFITSLMGEAYRKMSLSVNAMACFSSVMYLQPRSSYGYLGAARVFANSKNYSLSRYYCERALEQCSPNNNPYLYAKLLTELGLCCTYLKDYNTAIEAFTQILDASETWDENRVRALAFRERSYRLTGQPKRSLEDAKQLLQISQNDPRSLHQYGLSLLANGQERKAMMLFKKMTDSDPDPALVYLYGGMLLRRGQHQQVAQLAQRGLRRSPKSSALQAILIQAMFHSQPEKALALCLKALKKQPSSQYFGRALQAGYRQMGRLDEALELAYKLFLQAPDRAESSVILARTHGQMKHTRRARLWLEQAFRLKPSKRSSPELKALMARWESAENQ